MDLREARDIVFKQKKNLKKFIDTYGSKHWSDIVDTYYKTDFKESTRTEELTFIIKKYVTPLLGEEKTATTLETLQQTGFVSTCDHSGVLCHPFFLNNNIVRQSSFLKSIITFSCGGVSLTNSSYPRGIFFHDKNGEVIRLPFISLKGRRRSAYGHEPFTKDTITKLIQKVTSLNVSTHQKQILSHFLQKIEKTNAIFSQNTYGKQLTIINDMLWQKIFKEEVKPLVYIEVEEVVKELLLNFHLTSQTPISKILFDSKTRETYIRQFEKVVGAHHTETKSGSHIFWYIDKATDSRVQLFLEGNVLKNAEHNIEIEITPENLQRHLNNYTLLPSMAFCYGMLASYYHLTLGGGFSQIDYLENIVKAWEAVTKETSNTKTDIFTGEFVLTGIYNGKKVCPATSIDLLLYEGDKETDYLVDTPEASQAIRLALTEQTIEESIDAMMDEFVEIISGTKPDISDMKIHKTLEIR